MMLTLRIPPTVQDSLTALAKAHDMSRSALIRRYIAKGLAKEADCASELLLFSGATK